MPPFFQPHGSFTGGTADALDYDLCTAAIGLQIGILCIAAVQVVTVVAGAHIAVAELQMLAPRIARPIKFLYLNVTTFVTSEEALPSMRLFKGTMKNKDAFVLMSDGTEQSLYHKPTKTLAGIIVKLMHRTCLLDSGTMKAQLEDAFASVISRNTQDDCSIAILARPSTALCPITDLAFPKTERTVWRARLGSSY